MNDSINKINNDFEEFDENIEGKSIKGIAHVDKLKPTIDSLIGQWKNKILRTPDFQRKFVWTLQQSSRFIESMLLGVPIPSLMFYQDAKSKQLVVDGQQRIKSILYFVGDLNLNLNDIPKEEYNRYKFKLTGLSENSKYEGKSFEELDETDRLNLLYARPLDVNLIVLSNPDNLSSIYYIFERLNTGGTPLKPQEIRNCICAGKFNEFLLDLNKYPTWRKFFNDSNAVDHLQDVELILRFFALYDRIEQYSRPMKDYLTEYMKNMTNISDEDMVSKEKLFKSTIDNVYLHIGSRAFRPNNGINSAVFDSVMLAFAKNEDNIPADIKDKYERLCNNKEYNKYCGQSSGDNSYVRYRIQMANDYLFGKVEDINSKIIKLFDFPVSAGTGNWLGDESIEYKQIVVTNRKVDFALRISGDSMFPDIQDGDVVLVKMQKDVPSKKIGIFTYKNKAYCKQIIKSKKVIYLQSINSKKYKTIKIEDEDQFYVNGLVVDILPKDTITEQS